MIKNDKWIIEQSNKGMISPFEKKSIRKAILGTEKEVPTISWGLSSYGYDIRYLIQKIYNKQQQQRRNFLS